LSDSAPSGGRLKLPSLPPWALAEGTITPESFLHGCPLCGRDGNGIAIGLESRFISRQPHDRSILLRYQDLAVAQAADGAGYRFDG
jgi:hypothetical protein